MNLFKKLISIANAPDKSVVALAKFRNEIAVGRSKMRAAAKVANGNPAAFYAALAAIRTVESV